MNNEFRLLTEDELTQVYEEHMKRDFPPAELKPLDRLLQMMGAGFYEPYALFRDGRLISYAFYWKAGDPYVMLDYFAVVPEERNKGTGGALLREMLDRFCVDGRGVFGEVEIPETGDQAVDELRTRRLNFYGRAGMKQRGFRTKIYGVPFIVISYGPEISDAELMEVNRRIYRTAASGAEYEKSIFIPWEGKV